MANRSKEATFVADWNNIVDFKITEDNLRAPNYRFLYSTLESLLRHLNYDINAMKRSFDESPDAERLFNIKFVGLVNSLYQLTDKSHRFYYFDLIEPSTKKTLHVLKCLFNYLSYYCMVKDKVISTSNKIIHDYNAALKENNDLKTKIEQFKRHENNLERNRLEYEEKMPRISAELAQLRTDTRAIQKEIADKTDDIKEYEASVMKMEMQMVELGEKIVTDDEYEKRVRKIAELKREAAELEVTLEEIRHRNEIANNDVQNYTEIVDEMNSQLAKHPIKLYEDIVAADAALKAARSAIQNDTMAVAEMTKERDDLLRSNEDCISIIQQQNVDMARVEEEVKALQIRSAEQEDTHTHMLKEAEEEIANANERIEQLEHQMVVINGLFDEMQKRSDACFKPRQK